MDDLDDIEILITEIRTTIDLLYDRICDAKNDGHTYDELHEVTGLPRGTLQNIVAGRHPRI